MKRYLLLAAAVVGITYYGHTVLRALGYPEQNR